jgi:acetylornithine deacetylase
MKYPRSSQGILGRLISYDTTSWNSNLELIHFIKKYLEGFDFKVELIFNEEKNKANLFATLPSVTEGHRGGIILSGHTDVVPSTEQKWTSDAFTMVQRGDRLFGRGTCDMKGFIACVLAAVPKFSAADLKEPLHLAFSYDEEIGCTGCVSMIDHAAKITPLPRACIVGEPTSMKVINSHKGIRHNLTRIYGLEAHSSTDKGINAIEYAADMICFLRKIGDELKMRPPSVEGFTPPYTTVHVGRITGGTAANVTPSYCEFEWDYRPIPGSDQEEVIERLNAYVTNTLLPRMKERSADKGRIETELLANVPLLLPQTGSEAESLVLALAQENEVGVVSYGTEAGIFQGRAKIPTVVCGPGSILQAHKADEYIEISELEACDVFLGRLLDVMKG